MRNRRDANLLPTLRIIRTRPRRAIAITRINMGKARATLSLSPGFAVFTVLRNSHYVDNVDNCRAGTKEIPPQCPTLESFASRLTGVKVSVSPLQLCPGRIGLHLLGCKIDKTLWNQETLDRP